MQIVFIVIAIYPIALNLYFNFEILVIVTYVFDVTKNSVHDLYKT